MHLPTKMDAFAALVVRHQHRRRVARQIGVDARLQAVGHGVQLVVSSALRPGSGHTGWKTLKTSLHRASVKVGPRAGCCCRADTSPVRFVTNM